MIRKAISDDDIASRGPRVDESPSPVVSIVISTLNAEKTLDRCLQSVLQQTYPRIQIVLIDGASRDGTLDIVRHRANENLVWLSEPDHGIYDAWNKALPLATGEWIYFLGADDAFYDNHVIERFVSEQARCAPKPLILYGDVLFEHKRLPAKRVGRPWARSKTSAERIMPIPHQGTFHRKALFSVTGGFDASYRIAADYKKILESLKLAEPVYMSDFVVAVRGDQGVSSKIENRLSAMHENQRARAETESHTSFFFQIDLVKATLWSALSRLILRMKK